MLRRGLLTDPGVTLNIVSRACFHHHRRMTMGRAGASDDGSQVGVMLEVARALVADPSTRLVAPVVFAFNGGEETFSQARRLTVVHACVKGGCACRGSAMLPGDIQVWQSSP